MKFIPYSRQWLESDDIEEVIKVIKSDWITQGPKIKEFEEAVSGYTGAKYAVAVATGTAALHCACFAADVGKDDEIITSPLTFAASGNCGLFLGAKVKFVDIRPDTYCMDPRKLELAISRRTKAIIPVDFTGQPADIDEISSIAEKHGVTVIEDAAHSLGATYKKNKVGSLADMTILSFHPVKHITTGEGGMVLTDDMKFAGEMRLFRTHGITSEDGAFKFPDQAADNDSGYAKNRNPKTKAAWYYEMQALGYNYRITDIQCALGLSQLKKLDRFVARRRQIARRYNDAFGKSPYLIMPCQEPDRESSWHLYMLRLRLERISNTRRQIFDELRAKGIGVHVHYIPLHLQPYYRERFGYKRGDFPEAEAFYDSAITIPIFPSMEDADCNRVIEAVLETVDQRRR